MFVYCTLYDMFKFQVYEKRGELRNRKEQERIKAMSQEEKELEYKAVKLSALDSIESDSNYPTFFKLVVADEQA